MTTPREPTFRAGDAVVLVSRGGAHRRRYSVVGTPEWKAIDGDWLYSLEVVTRPPGEWPSYQRRTAFERALKAAPA